MDSSTCTKPFVRQFPSRFKANAVVRCPRLGLCNALCRVLQPEASPRSGQTHGHAGAWRKTEAEVNTMLRNILGLALLAAMTGAGLPARKEPDEKPKPEEPKKKQEPQGQDKTKPKPKEEPKQEPAPSAKERKPDEKQQKEQSKQEKKQHQSPSTGQAPGKPAQGKKIPAAKFHSSFGSTHHFRVTRSGSDNRHFQYGGYVFEVVEWPVGWYFDDECYIEEEGDDYYLVDVVRPELRVIVIVVSG